MAHMAFYDWTEIDAPALLFLMLMAGALAATRDHGFPPGTPDRPVERWVTMQYRFMLAAEQAGLPALQLVRPALLAVLAAPRPRDEFIARARRHSGFNRSRTPAPAGVRRRRSRHNHRPSAYGGAANASRLA